MYPVCFLRIQAVAVKRAVAHTTTSSPIALGVGTAAGFQERFHLMLGVGLRGGGRVNNVASVLVNQTSSVAPKMKVRRRREGYERWTDG